MKKLGKLSFSPEMIMKNEELINLKGGYAGGAHAVVCMVDGTVACETTADDCKAATVTAACQSMVDKGECGNWSQSSNCNANCS